MIKNRSMNNKGKDSIFQHRTFRSWEITPRQCLTYTRNSDLQVNDITCPPYILSIRREIIPDLNGRRHSYRHHYWHRHQHRHCHYHRATTPTGTADVTVRASDTAAIHRRLMNIYAGWICILLTMYYFCSTGDQYTTKRDTHIRIGGSRSVQQERVRAQGVRVLSYQLLIADCASKI